MAKEAARSVEDTTAIKEEIVEKIRRGVKSLVDFRAEFRGHGENEVVPAAFHYQWSHDLLWSERSFAIEGFRESAKSTYVIETYPEYCIFYPDPSRRYIILLKNTVSTAQKKLKEIERSVAENRWLKERILDVVECSGEAYEIVICAPGQPNNRMRFRIEAYGKGSSIRGLNWNNQRPNIVIADDLQDEEDAKSKSTLDNDWTWFRSEVGFLGRDTRFFMIANNLGENCIVEQIGNNPEIFNYIFYRVPIKNDEGVPSWPEMFDATFIKKEEEQYTTSGDIAVWLRNRMCVAVSPETQIFHKENLGWYVAEEKQNIIGKCSIYVAYDPKGDKTKTSDMSAIPVIGVDEDDYWYVLDIEYGRWGPLEQIDKLFEVVRAYKPYRVGIETVGQHGHLLRQSINKAMTEERCIFTPVWVTPSTKLSKLERVILALGQRIKLGKLIVPEKAPWLSEFLNEFLMTTKHGFKSKYVDLIDSLAQLNEFAKPPIGSSGSRGRLQSTKELPRSSIGVTVYR